VIFSSLHDETPYSAGQQASGECYYIVGRLSEASIY
jgi:hypothetical protein